RPRGRGRAAGRTGPGRGCLGGGGSRDLGYHQLVRLAAALRAALSEPLRAQADETLEPILAELVASARAAWPGLATGGEELVAYAGARLSGAAPLAETLAGLCAADLF